MVNPGAGGSDPLVEVASERFADQLGRTADRCRALSLARLAAPWGPEATRADAARALAQSLAETAAGLEGGTPRRLPRLADGAVGDQLAVCGRDVLVAAGSDHNALLGALADQLLDLRRRL